jgi:hypothetical protein
MSVYLARRLFCNVFPFPVCKAQFIGDWYENRRGAPITIIFLIFHQYYWRTHASCANRSGGPKTKKTYWRTVPGQLCLLVEGDIGAPIYWRTDAPRANGISAQKKKHLAGPQSKQSARLSLQSSELGSPPPTLKPQVSVSPLWYQGGHTCLQEREWVGSQYEGTNTVVL